MEKGSPLIGRSWIPPSPHEEKNIDKSSQFNIRCTAEQKELFQKAIANSGKSGAEFIQ
ncbi:MAG: hypothetical protein QG594_2097, partial [Bacteroidota bacterium]|nr:hypothetical protein [Bacteroidota bacterium]